MSQITPVQSVLVRSLTTTYSIAALRDDFIRYGYEIAEHSGNTMSTRRTHMKFFVEYCSDNNIDDIRYLNNVIIDEFFVEYSKTRKKSTVNTARRVLKVFLKWVEGYKETDVRANPDGIKLVKVRKPNPKAISDSIISLVLHETENDQDRLMIATLREGGLRACEIVNVTVDDVLKRQIQVTAGKDYADRNVYITPELANELRRFAAQNGRRGSDYLFQNVYKGYPPQMTTKTANKRIQKCFWRVAEIKMYMHQLRHTMAIEMLRGGADLVSIQRQLGHKDIVTTQEYLRVYDAFVEDAYTKSMPRSILAY